MPDLIRFVDSIASSPTTRLDLNDEVSWWVKSFSAPPPRLRRSMAANAMRDGISVGSASYDSRTLTIELDCRKATQDLAAIEIQKLWRELDRTANLIQYQPQGASKPVFFRTYRSDASQLSDVMAQQAMRTFTIEVLAEPFALGLFETTTTLGITNDTAGYFGSFAGVLGDVPAPVGIREVSGATDKNYIVMASTDSTVSAQQAETMTMGADTSVPAGGPDAAMSGTGTNNYARTTFAGTPTMATRLTTTTTLTNDVPRRVFAAVRRSDATSVIAVQFRVNGADVGAATPTRLTTSRQLVDLGSFVPATDSPLPGGVTGVLSATLEVRAERTSGSGTLDTDVIFLPSVDTTAILQAPAGSTWPAGAVVLMGNDGDLPAAYVHNSGSTLTAPADRRFAFNMSGALPMVTPGVTNYIKWLSFSGALWLFDKSVTSSVQIGYNPRYLFVRPSAS